MKNGEDKLSRGKFMKWLGITSVFAALGIAFTPKKKTGSKTVKMLTQDGRLVEIDESLLSANKKRVTDNELLTWVKNKN
jgi:hypothetical protein